MQWVPQRRQGELTEASLVPLRLSLCADGIAGAISVARVCATRPPRGPGPMRTAQEAFDAHYFLIVSRLADL